MKRHAFFLVFLLSLCVNACAEQVKTPPLADALRALYGVRGWEVLSESACGRSGAAVIEAESGYFLAMLSLNGETWQVDFENDRAVCSDSSVYLDNEDLLILSNPYRWSPQTWEQYYFELEDAWRLSSTILYEEGYDEWNLLYEYHTCLEDGLLLTDSWLTDAEDNAQRISEYLPLTNVLTDEELALSRFDGMNPPINGLGYLTDESMEISDEIVRRLFNAVSPAGMTYVDGLKMGAGMQFLADKADGSRVLLCCSCMQDGGWKIVQSTPLPAGTTMGIENFTDYLDLGGQGFGVRIVQGKDETWRAEGMLGRDCFEVGPCYVSDGVLWWNAQRAMGTTYWNDITTMDWLTIPHSLDEAKAAVDPKGWATPHNPDPEDRLHLRKAPRKDSQSLGKYYNGTPIRVLERGDDWTHVRIGETEGYMMTRYLAFDEDINRIETKLRGKMALHPMTDVLWEGEAAAQKLPGYEVSSLLITGVIEDEWYLVWSPEADRFGRIRQDALWEGNG